MHGQFHIFISKLGMEIVGVQAIRTFNTIITFLMAGFCAFIVLNTECNMFRFLCKFTNRIEEFDGFSCLPMINSTPTGQQCEAIKHFKDGVAWLMYGEHYHLTLARQTVNIEAHRHNIHCKTFERSNTR